MSTREGQQEDGAKCREPQKARHWNRKKILFNRDPHFKACLNASTYKWRALQYDKTSGKPTPPLPLGWVRHKICTWGCFPPNKFEQ